MIGKIAALGITPLPSVASSSQSVLVGMAYGVGTEASRNEAGNGRAGFELPIQFLNRKLECESGNVAWPRGTVVAIPAQVVVKIEVSVFVGAVMDRG